ncbi:unnamed protein product [Prorocentrum cordatum]|uniref:Subtilisin n=1 Tax=Prorocentrum cordatum TaxID=2364126 RepID=A0ABN9RGU2_9DINO|nr:unnamed protein product [Polarella glacialis]
MEGGSVPPEFLHIAASAGAMPLEGLSAIRPPVSPATAARAGEILETTKANAVVCEKSSFDEIDINAQRIEAVRNFVQRLDEECAHGGADDASNSSSEDEEGGEKAGRASKRGRVLEETAFGADETAREAVERDMLIQLSNTVSVTTSFEVEVSDISAATSLSNTIAGAADAIKVPPSPAPTTSPTLAPTTEPPAQWYAEITGGCTVSNGCVRSPNYPEDYSNEDECEITLTSEGVWLTPTSFDVESYFDSLTVNGVSYDGTSSNALTDPVFATTTIYWSPDSYQAAAGWELCPTPAPTQISTPSPPNGTGAPTSTPSEYPWYAAITGGCTVTNGCVRSPNYPQDYTNDDECEIALASEGVWLTPTSFDVESYFDSLTVNGVSYDGTSWNALTEPVFVTATIYWSPDSYQAAAGWELCPTPAPTQISTPSPPVGTGALTEALVGATLTGARAEEPTD